MFARYHFTTLSYQESLGGSSPMPFAVIVESKRYVYCISYRVAGDETTVTGLILKNFQEILEERVTNASRVARAEGSLAITELCKEFGWNVRAEKPQTKRALFAGIERFAGRLFAKRIERRQLKSAVAVRPEFRFRVPAIA